MILQITLNELKENGFTDKNFRKLMEDTVNDSISQEELDEGFSKLRLYACKHEVQDVFDRVFNQMHSEYISNAVSELEPWFTFGFKEWSKVTPIFDEIRKKSTEELRIYFLNKRSKEAPEYDISEEDFKKRYNQYCDDKKKEFKALKQEENKKKCEDISFLEPTNSGLKINPVKLYDAYVDNCCGFNRFMFVKSGNSKSRRRYIYNDEKGVYEWVDDKAIKGDIKHFIIDAGAGEYRTMKAINEVYEDLIIETDFDISEDDVNTDENIINFKNGILHLDTMKITDHSPQLHSTIQLPCEWNGEQPTPLFDEYMKTFTQGNKEKEQLLLEYMGGCLSNVYGYRFKKALFVVGDPDSGKSVLRDLTTRLIGKDNQIGGSLSSLNERFGLFPLYQKRVFGSSELGYMSVSQTDKFKQITGGDNLNIEQKGDDVFSYKYLGFCWFCSNKLPRVCNDEATFNRMIIVKADNSIPIEKQNKHLIEDLLKEASGIVYKCIMAFREAVNRGYHFTIPSESVSLMQVYKQSCNYYLQFFNECCEMRKKDSRGNYIYNNDSVTTSVILEIMRKWADKNIESDSSHPVPKLTTNGLKNELRIAGYDAETHKFNDCEKYHFTLNTATKTEYHIIDKVSTV